MTQLDRLLVEFHDTALSIVRSASVISEFLETTSPARKTPRIIEAFTNVQDRMNHARYLIGRIEALIQAEEKRRP